LLEILLNYPELRRRVIREITEADTAGLRTRELFRLLAEFDNQGEEPSYAALSSRLEDDHDLAQDLLPRLMIGNVSGGSETNEDLKRLEREAIESLKGLRFSLLAERQAALQAEINEAQRAGDLARVSELTMRKFELARQERALGQS
jgi:hypothetical protein